ncbi:MAG: hypothetical protein K0Q77_73 [Anaerosporomusa subterranea]|jgi:hypothetical protein|nr:hypothetical protein [Anaerosporomusa subterranea]
MGSKMVDADIYDFLRCHECHLFKRNVEVFGWVVVPFDDLGKFQSIVNKYEFQDGLEVTMKLGYIAIELNNFIEIENYKNCFDNDEWRDYFPESPTGEGKADA